MSSSSGDNSRAGKTPTTAKLKITNAKNNAKTPGFEVMGKKGKVLKNTNSLVSSSFQQTNENPPILNTECFTFNFDDVTVNMLDFNITLVDNQLNEHTPDVSLSTDNTPLSNTDMTCLLTTTIIIFYFVSLHRITMVL